MNHLRGAPDLADTTARLQFYQEAGADVRDAPGLADLDEIRSLSSSVDRPVNALIRPAGPSIAELFAAGARRISVGSAISLAAQAATAVAAREMLEEGTHHFWSKALPHLDTINQALAPDG